MSTFLVLHTPVTSAPSDLGDLHGERAHASRRAVDQDLLPRLNLSLVAKTLQRGDRRDRDRCRLLERQVGRLQHHGPILGNAHDTRPRPRSSRRIPRRPGGTASRSCRPLRPSPRSRRPAGDLRLAQPGPEAHDVRRASHVVPVQGVHGRRADSHQELIVRWGSAFRCSRARGHRRNRSRNRRWPSSDSPERCCDRHMCCSTPSTRPAPPATTRAESRPRSTLPRA